MSVRILVPFILLLLFSSCNNSASSATEVSQWSETEKDSLAEMYHELSMQFYQPSALHRKFKDSALAIRPENVEYRQRLSYSYKKTGEHIKAMELLNEAVAIDVANGNTAALQYRAWSLLFFYRDYEGCIEDVDLINEMEPANDYTTCHGEPCNLLKGQALYRLGKYEEAIEVFQALLEVEKEKGWDPSDNFMANFYMARCFSELTEYNKALEIYAAQLVQDDRYTEVHYQMGRIYNLLGAKDRAKKHLKKAEELLASGYEMNEPYYEAFDEVFLYQIEEELSKTSQSPRHFRRID